MTHTKNLSRVIILLLLLPLSIIRAIPTAQAVAAIQGQMVLDVGTGWDAAFVFRPVVINDGSTFMMWYSGEDTKGNDNIGLATSTDGVNWSRYSGNPVLAVGPSGAWDSGSVTEAWVIRESGQYKMWYGGQLYASNGNIQSYLIGYATSPDGIHWAKYSGNPVLTVDTAVSWDDKWVWRPAVVPTGSGYVMYFRGASNLPGTQAKAGVATSSDGTHWTKTVVLTMPTGSSGWDAFSRSTGALNFGSVINAGTYVMGYSSIKTQSSLQEIGFASSSDGTNWTPYSGNPVITYGSSGWDSGGVSRPMVVTVADKYYVYYDGSVPKGAIRIGLAVLPMSQYAIPEYSSNQLVLVLSILVSMGLIGLRRKLSVR